MSVYRIPYVDLPRQYETLREEMLDAQDQVYRSGQVLDGRNTQVFEASIAARCDRKYAVAVNSCTNALMFAVTASAGSGVLLPSLSFVASVNAVLASGRTPHFTDVDDQGLLNIDTIDRHLPDHDISIMMYVNLYGNVLDQDRLKVYTDFFNSENRIAVIEDAAQSFGSSWRGRPSGSLGDISCLSFDPMKNLPNYGSGGMVLTDDAWIAEAILDLRDNGKRSNHLNWGINCKMSEADCAAMLVKLRYFDSWQARRREIAEYYTQQLRTNRFIRVPQVSEEVEHCWHKYVVQTDMRKKFLAYMADECGIECRVHYDYVLPSFFTDKEVSPSDYHVARQVKNQVVSLPIYPELTDSEVESIADAAKRFNTWLD